MTTTNPMNDAMNDLYDNLVDGQGPVLVFAGGALSDEEMKSLEGILHQHGIPTTRGRGEDMYVYPPAGSRAHRIGKLSAAARAVFSA